MAIASVARKATIRRDDTLLKTQAIVDRQKALAQQMALAQQKQKADQEEAKAKRSAKNLELALKTGDIKDTHFAREFQPMMTTFQEMNTSGAPQKEIENQILKMDNYTKLANAAFEESKELVGGIVGSEEQRKLRNKDAVMRQLSDYTGSKKVNEWDKIEAQEAVDNNIDTYNGVAIVKSFAETQQEQVTNNVKVKTGGLFSQAQESTQTARFLKIDPATGDWERGKDGKPIAVISNEQLAAFKDFSKYGQLAIDEYIANHTVKNYVEDPNNKGFYIEGEPKAPTELEAMENILRDSGAFNIDEETSTKVMATPKEDANLVKQRLMLANVSDRLAFVQRPNEMLSVIKSGRGVVDEANVTTVDGKPKPYSTDFEKLENGDIEYTIVIDPNKLVDRNLMTIELPDGRGGVSEYGAITDKTSKIQVRKITVDKDNPIAGLIQLSQVYNATVDAKDRVDPDDLLKEWNRQQNAGTSNPFEVDLRGNKTEGGGTEPRNPFEIDLKN